MSACGRHRRRAVAIVLVAAADEQDVREPLAGQEMARDVLGVLALVLHRDRLEPPIHEVHRALCNRDVRRASVRQFDVFHLDLLKPRVELLDARGAVGGRPASRCE